MKQKVQKVTEEYLGGIYVGCHQVYYDISRDDPFGLVGVLRKVALEISAKRKKPIVLQAQRHNLGIEGWHDGAENYIYLAEKGSRSRIIGLWYNCALGGLNVHLYEDYAEEDVLPIVEKYLKEYRDPIIKRSCPFNIMDAGLDLLLRTV